MHKHINNIHSKPTRQVGFVLKSHGYKGHLKIELSVDYVPTDFLLLEINDKFVPFSIESYNSSASIIKLIGFDEIEHIQHLLNVPILDFANESDLDSPNIIGYTLLDQVSGAEYEILDLIENPGQNLIEFRHGFKDVLLPVHEDIIMDIDHDNKIVSAQFPDGILDL
jgi:16S rRNA processing protein RimM